MEIEVVFKLPNKEEMAKRLLSFRFTSDLKERYSHHKQINALGHSNFFPRMSGEQWMKTFCQVGCKTK